MSHKPYTRNISNAVIALYRINNAAQGRLVFARLVNSFVVA